MPKTTVHKNGKKFLGKTKSGLPGNGRCRRHPEMPCSRNNLSSLSSVERLLFPRIHLLTQFRGRVSQQFREADSISVSGIPLISFNVAHGDDVHFLAVGHVGLGSGMVQFAKQQRREARHTLRTDQRSTVGVGRSVSLFHSARLPQGLCGRFCSIFQCPWLVNDGTKGGTKAVRES